MSCSTRSMSASERAERLTDSPLAVPSEVVRESGRDVQFCKSAEAQKRGAMHFHALVRCQADLTASVVPIRQLAIKHGFGHSVDLQAAKPSDAWYCAKYASKAAEDRFRP